MDKRVQKWDFLSDLNKYVHLFNRNDKWYLFANYKNRLWSLSQDEATILSYVLSCGEPNKIDTVCSKKIDAYLFLRELYQAVYVDDSELYHYDNNLSSMILLITESCNFACTYCYGAYGEKNGSMTFDTAKHAVDLAFELGIKDIVFFGGEPLLNFALIKDVVAYIDTLQIEDVRLRITTNGSLVNEEIAQFFVAHDIDVSVSMDGDVKSQNETRVLKGGASSYQQVLNGIEILKKHDLLSLIEVTYSSRHNADMTQQLEAALALCPNVTCACVDGKPNCKHERDVIRGRRLLDFYSQVLDFNEKHVENGIIGVQELYDKIASGEVLQLPQCLCSDIATRLIITSQGNIAPCPEMTDVADYIIGNVNTLDKATFNKSRDEVLSRLSSAKVEREWFSGLCETCIQHVIEHNGQFIYNDKKGFSECIEGLLVRLANKNG